MTALILLTPTVGCHLHSSGRNSRDLVRRFSVRASPQLSSPPPPPRRCVVRAQNSSEREPNFLDKLQANLPVVGLFSRIVSPSGLKGVRTGYAEYCRSILEKKSPELVVAYESLYQDFGRRANSRFILFGCWAALIASSIIPKESLVTTMKIIAASQDVTTAVEELESILDEPANVKKMSKTELTQINQGALLAGELVAYLIPEAKSEEDAMKIAKAVYYTIMGPERDDSLLTAIQAAVTKEIQGISEEEDEEDEYEVRRRILSEAEEAAFIAGNAPDDGKPENDQNGPPNPPQAPPPVSSSS